MLRLYAFPATCWRHTSHTSETACTLADDILWLLSTNIIGTFKERSKVAIHLVLTRIMIADQLLQLSLLMATSPHRVQNAVKGLCYQLRQHVIPSLLQSDRRPVRVRDRRCIHPLYTVPHHELNLTWTLSSVSDRHTEVPANLALLFGPHHQRTKQSSLSE